LFKSKYVINSDKLKSTRERAKLSLEDAASSCSLSSQQINSLENGLDVGFFNAHFKEIAAKKYIKYLGLSQSDILMHEEAIPSEEVESSEQTLTPQTNFHRLIKIAIKKKKTTIISVLAVTLLLMLALKDPIENEIPADALISDSQTDVSLSEEPIRINEPDDHSHSSPSPIIAKTDEVPVNNSNDCTNLLNTDNFQNYRTKYVPEKPNNYIHIKSSLTQTLCIQSGNEEAKSIVVTESEPLNFKGGAPFLLQINEPDKVEVYFQGWKVWLNPNFQVFKINSYQDPTLTSLE
jgi:transcriptional regulator with XRE-family HTH domain